MPPQGYAAAPTAATRPNVLVQFGDDSTPNQTPKRPYKSMPFTNLIESIEAYTTNPLARFFSRFFNGDNPDDTLEDLRAELKARQSEEKP